MSKRIYAAHLNQYIVVGGVIQPTRDELATLPKLKEFGIDYSQIPLHCDLTPKALPILRRVLLNNIRGDCFIAAMNHLEGCAVEENGGIFNPSDAQITTEYSGACGFNPSDPQNTDNGCTANAVFSYYKTKGFSNGTKINGAIQIDNTNPEEVAAAIYLMGAGVIVTTGLPDAWISPFPSADGYCWHVTSKGENWDNGHAYYYPGYKTVGGKKQFKTDSWGLFGWQSEEANAKYSINYAVLTPDIIAKGKQKAPNGLDWKKIEEYFKGFRPPPIPATL